MHIYTWKICIWVCMCTHAYICMYKRINAYICVHKRINVYMHVPVHGIHIFFDMILLCKDIYKCNLYENDKM